jgi:hypothetical protein
MCTEDKKCSKWTDFLNLMEYYKSRAFCLRNSNFQENPKKLYLWGLICGISIGKLLDNN